MPDELIAPNLTIKEVETMVRPMALDLSAFFKALQEEALGLVAQAEREGWTVAHLEKELVGLIEAPAEVKKSLDGRREFQGLKISIENRKGSVREGENSDGTEWSTKMTHPYGYIRMTEGNDGDHVDCFIGPNEDAPYAYVIAIQNPETKEYDEDKVMLGFDSEGAAKAAFHENYDDPRYFQSCTSVSVDKLKELMAKRKGERLIKKMLAQTMLDFPAIAKAAKFDEGEHPRARDGEFKPKGGAGKVPAFMTKAKIRVPPAWTEVEITKDPKAKLWVSGKDSKGRTQSIYNPEFVAARKALKFKKNASFEEHSDKFAALNEKNAKSGSHAAACLALILATGIRVGSDKDTGGEKQAYGASTLEGRHVFITSGGDVRLRFVGKKGVKQSVDIDDPALAAALKSRKKKAGDDGRLFDVDYNGMLAYTKDLGGFGFTPKNARTFLGTNHAKAEMDDWEAPENEKEYKICVREVCKVVAEKLGNTPKVALDSYIDPSVWRAWRKRAGV